MTWSLADVVWLGVSEADSAGDVETIRIGTPVGEVLIMAEIELAEGGRRLVAWQAHIQSESGANTIGIANLRMIAERALERVDCDDARIDGAVRTSGAGPGRRPRPFRFARRRRDPA